MSFLESIKAFMPFIVFLCSAVLMIVAWLLSRAIGTLDKHSEKISDISLRMERDFVKHDSLKELRRETKEDFDKIDRKLDNLLLELRK